MKSLFLALLLTVALPVAAAAGKKRIVIIGDSITEGYGVASALAYPSLMQKKADAEGLKWEVVNAGISGSTTSSALLRLTWHLKKKPDLIVLALGANDGLRGIEPKLVEENLAKAIEECKNNKVKVLLVGMKLPPNYGDAYLAKYKIIWGRLASRYKIPFVPFLLEGVAGNPSLNQADGIHPNEKGQVIIGDMMFTAIKKNL